MSSTSHFSPPPSSYTGASAQSTAWALSHSGEVGLVNMSYISTVSARIRKIMTVRIKRQRGSSIQRGAPRALTACIASFRPVCVGEWDQGDGGREKGGGRMYQGSGMTRDQAMGDESGAAV